MAPIPWKNSFISNCSLLRSSTNHRFSTNAISRSSRTFQAIDIPGLIYEQTRNYRTWSYAPIKPRKFWWAGASAITTALCIEYARRASNIAEANETRASETEQSLHRLQTSAKEEKALPSRPLNEEDLALLKERSRSPEYFTKLANLLVSNGGNFQWPSEIEQFLQNFDGLQTLLDTLLQEEHRYSKAVFSIGKDNFDTLYGIAIQRKMHFNWGSDGIDTTLFLEQIKYGLWTEMQRPKQSDHETYILLKINPSLAQSVTDQGKSAFTFAMETGATRAAKEILKAMEGKGYQLSIEERWMRMALLDDSSFSDRDFKGLSQEARESFYQMANIHDSGNIVARLNVLGMRNGKTTYTPPWDLQLLSESMDTLQAWETIGNFLIEQRRNGCLLTSEEFKELESKQTALGCSFLKKGDLNRLIGRNMIEKAIQELHLSFVKVPKKIAVINNEAQNSGEIWLRRFTDGTRVTSDDLLVYAQKINTSQRFLRFEEMKELITLIEKVGLEDIWDYNFVVADDGIYCIDTESKSFGSVPYGKLYRLERLLHPKDHAAFDQLIQSSYAAREARRKKPSGIDWETIWKEKELSEKYFGLAQRHAPYRFSFNELTKLAFNDEKDIG